MKFFKTLVFCLGAFLFYAVSLFSRPAIAKSFNIGVSMDCKASLQGDLLKDIKNEILSLTKGEFDVRFPNQFKMVADCTEKGTRESIEKLMSHPGVDLVLTLDPLGSHVLAKQPAFSKPCIAGLIINPELQGIPLKDNKSGKHNLAYVAFSPDIKGNVELFKQIVPFKKAALLYDDRLSLGHEPEKIILDRLEKKTKTDLTYIRVGRSAGPVIEKLGKETEAVFLTDLGQLDQKSIAELVSHFKENKIASFTFHDRTMIEKGLLAGFDRTSEMMRFSRRIALMVQRVLLNEDPSEFNVGFSSDENLVINMQTAKQMGISPNFSLLARAELINAEPLITTDRKPAGAKQAGEIKISEAVTRDSNEMDAAGFGLSDGPKSLSLLDAVNLALEKNLVLKSKAREVAAGKMDVKEALSSYYPQFSTGLTGKAIDDDHTSAISGVAERSWDIALSVSQLIYSDKVVTNVKTSRHAQKALELSGRQEELDVILESALAYLSMLKSRANARIQLDNLKLIRSNLVLANNRYKAGFSSPSDVYRLESEAAIAYSNFLNALAEVGKARIHLNQILNIDLEAQTTIKDIKLDESAFIISDPKTRDKIKIDNPGDFKLFRDFFVKKGIEKSPELAALEEQIRIQTALYDLNRRSYWSPDVYVAGNVGNTFSKDGDGSDFNASALPGSLSSVFSEPDDTRWTVSLNVEVPFYEGGAKEARKINALETRNQLRFFKNNTENLISENIRTALLDISASYPSIELTKVSADSARKNLDLVQDAYSQGAVSIVNFLDAQNAALVANTSAENAVYDFFTDYLVSERAAGHYSMFMTKDEKRQWIQDFQN